MFGVKLGVGSVKTIFLFFFFGLHQMFWGKLDVGRRKGLVEMCLTVTFKFLVITFKHEVEPNREPVKAETANP